MPKQIKKLHKLELLSMSSRYASQQDPDESHYQDISMDTMEQTKDLGMESVR